jgi:hypothetical protein
MAPRDRLVFPLALLALLPLLAGMAGCGRSYPVAEKPTTVLTEESHAVEGHSEKATDHVRSDFSILEEDRVGELPSAEAILDRVAETVQAIQTFRVRQIMHREGEVQPELACVELFSSNTVHLKSSTKVL